MTEEQLNEVRLKIAENIRTIREQAGITQEELAEKTGLGIKTIERFESGLFWLNMKQFIMIRVALNMPETL